MADRWLFKEEPSHYGFDDLVDDGSTVWDGVRNNLAAKYLRQVREGDEILYYHTGRERAVVGVMRAVADPVPDPDADAERFVVVEVAPVRRLESPVSLSEIKEQDVFDGSDLVRIPRLSVAPISEAQWSRVMELADEGSS